MEKVKILRPIYVEQTGIQYREGETTDVPKYLADRHAETGFMEIVNPDKPIPSDKNKGK